MNHFRPTVLRMKELCKATVACSKALNGLNMSELQMPSGGCS